jgi:hypothetical protein
MRVLPMRGAVARGVGVELCAAASSASRDAVSGRD